MRFLSARRLDRRRDELINLDHIVTIRETEEETKVHIYFDHSEYDAAYEIPVGFCILEEILAAGKR